MKGINFDAFQSLMTKFIQKMKTQTCWKLLKHFGYDSNLQIKKQIWDDKSIFEDVFTTSRSFEMTNVTVTFLKKIFKQYANSNNKLNS